MKVNKKTVIIHFQPLELFPPVMNFISTAARSKDFSNELYVLTTKSQSNQRLFLEQNVNIKRLNGISPLRGKLFKLLKYFHIYSYFTFFLILKRPKFVIYFETLSALPAIVYYFLCSKKGKPLIFIHYHEIVTLDELSKGRWLNKKINSFEKRIYKNASWISQTNAQRIKIFQQQYGLENKLSKFHTLPNYPPSSWLKVPKERNSEIVNVIKLVHIGALSIKGMYLENILAYAGNSPKFSIDFYSHKFTPEIKELLSKYSNCQVKGSIAYEDIPTLKGKYDVGLVLYNALSLNVKYCAPNKIFEYLALDLDVWCSDKLITAKEHERLNCYPKMIMLDFERLQDFDVEKALSREGLEHVFSPYFCEPVYETLLNEINENSNS